MLAQTTLFDKPTGLIGAQRALVRAVDRQVDPMEVAQPKTIVQQQTERLAPIAAPPISLVADRNAEHGCLCHIVKVKERALANKQTIGLNRKAGTVTPAFTGLAVEFG